MALRDCDVALDTILAHIHLIEVKGAGSVLALANHRGRKVALRFRFPVCHSLYFFAVDRLTTP
ncbi:hypothetical protein SAMN03159496_05995 [Rhizobium sp. NFR07]|nr:hypothetical protein SAMN03159496_05995 [Rhizobium sp. NFR07]